MANILCEFSTTKKKKKSATSPSKKNGVAGEYIYIFGITFVFLILYKNIVMLNFITINTRGLKAGEKRHKFYS